MCVHHMRSREYTYSNLRTSYYPPGKQFMNACRRVAGARARPRHQILKYCREVVAHIRVRKVATSRQRRLSQDHIRGIGVPDSERRQTTLAHQLHQPAGDIWAGVHGKAPHVEERDGAIQGATR